MPNWIHNEVVMTHSDPHKLEEIANIFKNEQPFNQLIPEPDWPNIPAESVIRDSQGETTALKGELPKKEVIKYSTGETFYWNWPSSGRQDARWYDWRRAHWGCKWDIHDVDVDYQVANNMVELRFETPWSPPDTIYKKLCEMGYEFIQWEWQDECEECVHNLVPLEVVA